MHGNITRLQALGDACPVTTYSLYDETSLKNFDWNNEMFSLHNNHYHEMAIKLQKVFTSSWWPFWTTPSGPEMWYGVIENHKWDDTKYVSIITVYGRVLALYTGTMMIMYGSHIHMGLVLEGYKAPCYWPFVRGINQSLVDSLTKDLVAVYITGLGGGGGGGAYGFLRVLKFSPVNKIHIVQCMGEIFCVEFPHKISYPYIERCNFILHWHFKSS